MIAKVEVDLRQVVPLLTLSTIYKEIIKREKNPMVCSRVNLGDEF